MIVLNFICKKSEGCNVDLENDAHATAYDYAYSVSVQEHLKGIIW